MSIGQRIAQKRKEQGLSQEALGEQLGVSRQSISKWESDTAMPEIEKLVAMSRLFSVSVGWLLGVEEEREQESAASGQQKEELTEGQLKMVEEIVGRYLAAQPKPMSKRRKRVFKIAIAVAAVCLTVGIIKTANKLDNLDNQYNNLQHSVNNVTSSVNNQIGSIAGRVEEVLKAQNALTADYGVERLERDLKKNTVVFSAYAVPKTYREGMTATFLMECGGELLEFAGELGEGNAFSTTMTVPLTDIINISVVFVDGDTSQTQLLESVTGLYSRSIPEGYVEDTWQFDECVWRENGWLTIPAGITYARPYWENDDGYYGDSFPPAELAEMKVGIFKNQELVCWLTERPKPSTYHGFDDCLFFAYEEQRIPFTEDDTLCLATVVTDEYGRTTVRGGSKWELKPLENQEAEEKKLLYLDEIGDAGYYRYDAPSDWGL